MMTSACSSSSKYKHSEFFPPKDVFVASLTTLSPTLGWGRRILLHTGITWEFCCNQHRLSSWLPPNLRATSLVSFWAALDAISSLSFSKLCPLGSPLNSESPIPTPLYCSHWYENIVYCSLLSFYALPHLLPQFSLSKPNFWKRGVCIQFPVDSSTHWNLASRPSFHCNFSCQGLHVASSQSIRHN